MIRQQNRTFRIVCAPAQMEAVRALLLAEGYVFEPEPFSPWAFRLVREPKPLGASIAAFFGLVYIQDRSSMLPVLAARPDAAGLALDMCASPGSKTGFLGQLVPPGAAIVANEPNRVRLGTLRRNMAVLSMANVALTSRPGEDLPLIIPAFDTILLDAPCSGWGTVERNPQVTRLWRGRRLEPLIALQRRLLERAALLLAPGGRLVYSTCTTNPQENEEQTLFAVNELGLRLVRLPAVEGFAMDEPHDAGAAGAWRVNGADSQSQGFYVAAFEKEEAPPSAPPEPPARIPGAGGEALDASCLEEAGLDRRLPGPGRLAAFEGTVHFLPRRAEEALAGRIAWQGFALGRLGPGGRLRPFSRLRSLMGAPRAGRDLDVEAVEPLAALLQGQSLRLDGSGAGRAGLYFRGLPLGLISVKNGRALWSEA